MGIGGLSLTLQPDEILLAIQHGDLFDPDLSRELIDADLGLDAVWHTLRRFEFFVSDRKRQQHRLGAYIFRGHGFVGLEDGDGNELSRTRDWKAFGGCLFFAHDGVELPEYLYELGHALLQFLRVGDLLDQLQECLCIFGAVPSQIDVAPVGFLLSPKVRGEEQTLSVNPRNNRAVSRSGASTAGVIGRSATDWRAASIRINWFANLEVMVKRGTKAME